MSEILTTLKWETRELHARVESLVPVFSKAFNIGDYRRLLERFYGFYAGFEPAISRTHNLSEILPDWRERSKLVWLESDLLFLGLKRSDLAGLAVCTEVPPVHLSALAMGALYVTEGSTLGGQFICRQVTRSLALLPGDGTMFFYGHGEDTARRWREFARCVKAFATPANERLIVQSAIDTFQAIELWLSKDRKGEYYLGGHEQFATFAR